MIHFLSYPPTAKRSELCKRKMQSGGYLLETLKSSLLFNFHTGNVIFDTLVTGIIICLSTYLMSLASKLQEFDVRAWLDFLFFGTSTSNEITISGKKLEGAHSTKCNYSTTFQALLYQIKKLDCASSNISKLSEIQLEGDLDDYSKALHDNYGHVSDADKSNQREPNLIVSQKNPFKIGK